MAWNDFSRNWVLRVSIRYNGWGEACPIENTWVDLANATFNDTSTWYDGNGEYRIVASSKSGEKTVISEPINNDVVFI